MSDGLQYAPIIIVIVLALALGVSFFVIRRRRASADDVLPPPELGQSIDYTVLTYDEPVGFADRLKSLPIGMKLLLILIPVVLIVAAVIFFLLLGPMGQNGQPTPVPVLHQITDVTANVAGETKILIKASTDLPNGTPVTAALKENGQDFAWFDPQTASTQVNSGIIQLTLLKLKDAPAPKQDQEYTVVLTAADSGQQLSSDPVTLETKGPYQAAFYQIAAAATPTPKPTTAPTKAPTAKATTPTVAPTPTVTPTQALTATVFNGGNIRQRARIEACTNCPQLHAGETVQLLEKTADGRWYRVTAPAGTGWVSSTLLRIDGAVARQVPIEGQSTPTPAPKGTPAPAGTPTGLTAKVFNGGNVRERPVSGKPLDQINAGETVQLVAKTADGVWYKIVNERNITGWVHVSLLTIDRAVVAKVPIAS